MRACTPFPASRITLERDKSTDLMSLFGGAEFSYLNAWLRERLRQRLGAARWAGACHELRVLLQAVP